MLDLSDARAVFAAFLAENSHKRSTLDASLMHVVEWAYNHAYAEGFADGKVAAIKEIKGEDTPWLPKAVKQSS